MPDLGTPSRAPSWLVYIIILVIVAVGVVIFTTAVNMTFTISCLLDTVAVMCSSAQHELSEQLMHFYNGE